MNVADLKSADDVKEFLENLLTEYQFGCYNEKNAEACHLLGDYKSEIEQKYQEAAEIYKKNCHEFNFARSCTKYGGYLSVGRAGKVDVPTGFQYMKKGCELNDDSGCFQAGVVALSDRDNGVKDEAERVKEGVKFFEKCCYEFNNDRGCFQLSEIYLHGVEPHIQATPEKALKISENCCELGNAYACRNLAVMYRDGYGVPTDKKMFKKYKERAMDLVKQAQALRRETIFLQKKS